MANLACERILLVAQLVIHHNVEDLRVAIFQLCLTNSQLGLH